VIFACRRRGWNDERSAAGQHQHPADDCRHDGRRDQRGATAAQQPLGLLRRGQGAQSRRHPQLQNRHREQGQTLLLGTALFQSQQYAFFFLNPPLSIFVCLFKKHQSKLNISLD